MPLLPGDSKNIVSHNIKEMVGAGHPQKQAVAAALETARRHHAAGGMSGPKMPKPLNTVRETYHIGGLFKHSTPGRADKIKVSVPAHGYVIPADIVSGIGQGNTEAGAKALDSMVGTPYGVKAGKSAPSLGKPTAPKLNQKTEKQDDGSFSLNGKFAGGGETTSFVPIYASGGEYFIHPDKVKEIGGGDIDHGADILDKFVVHMRKKITDTTKKLPPPKGSK